MKIRIFCLLLAAVLLFGVGANAAPETEQTAQYVLEAVSSPQVGSVGGEWAVVGLVQSGAELPEGYLRSYRAVVEEYVKSRGGVLHKRKYTEYARVSYALCVMGEDPRNVGGYDILKPLEEYEKVIWQGNNGPAWALIVLDEAGSTAAVKQRYVDYLLSVRADGGWGLTDNTTDDVDVTAMVLQALAAYQQQPSVAQATEKALTWLAEQVAADGGYATSESISQVLIALVKLGISTEDARFTRGGVTLRQALLRYRVGAAFCHVAQNREADLMSTEQALMALAACDREKLSLPAAEPEVQLPAEKPEAPAAKEPVPSLPAKPPVRQFENMAAGCCPYAPMGGR